MSFNLRTRRWQEAAENTILADFQQWFQAHQPALQAQGIVPEFQPEREEQTVKASNLSAELGPCYARITLWETGDFDAEIWDLSEDISLADDDRVQLIHRELTSFKELRVALDDVFERLLAMPERR